jgi:hypothetical protein
MLILYSGSGRGCLIQDWFVRGRGVLRRRGVLLARGLLEDGEQLRGLLGD